MKNMVDTDTQNADGTVGKALFVLDQVAAFNRPVRMIDIQADCPYPKGTLYRLLQTLVRQRLLTYDPDRQSYAPGLRLVRLAHSAWARFSLAPIAREHITALSEQLGETVHLAQLDGGQVLYVDKVNAQVPVQMFSQAGKVGPTYCTGVGKAMLAYLSDETRIALLAKQSWYRYTPKTICTPDAMQNEVRAIRARGYAFDDEEHENGIICIALPILGDNNKMLGAVSVTSTTTKTNLDGLAAHAPAIHNTVQSIARAAQDWAFPS